jgi:hypothetical protein
MNGDTATVGGVSVPEACTVCGQVIYLPTRYISRGCSGCASGYRTTQITDRSPMDQHKAEAHG